MKRMFKIINQAFNRASDKVERGPKPMDYVCGVVAILVAFFGGMFLAAIAVFYIIVGVVSGLTWIGGGYAITAFIAVALGLVLRRGFR